MNENGYRRLNSKSCISIMSRLSMNNLFEVLYSRRTIAKIVEPMSNGASLTRKTLTSTTKQIASEVVQGVVDTSVKLHEQTNSLNHFYYHRYELQSEKEETPHANNHFLHSCNSDAGTWNLSKIVCVLWTNEGCVRLDGSSIRW